MSFQKIDKEFTLSDSSVNKYGMRLMTSGYDLDEYLKNPIGYHMHKYGDGVAMKWEDIRLDGDKVVGKPVINMNHPAAQRIVDEINDGFLNAASAGKIVLKEYHLDDNPEDPENPLIVATKWWNKEYSTVYIPGNSNALVESAMALYDGDDNEVTITGLIQKKKIHFMKKIEMELTPELMGILGLDDSKATGENVLAAIKNIAEENTNLTTANTELRAGKDQLAADRVKELCDQGLADGKMNKATRDRLEKQFAGKPVELQELISEMPKYTSITDRLQDGGFPAELADKTWEELHKADKLGDIKTKYPAKYKELYLAKFGVEPK